MRLPPLDTHDGRRAWAFLAVWGGAAVFTLFAAAGVYFVRNSEDYSFKLALAAHFQVLVGMTALGWAMGRRIVGKFTKDGAEINDTAGDDE